MWDEILQASVSYSAHSFGFIITIIMENLQKWAFIKWLFVKNTLYVLLCPRNPLKHTYA